MRAAPAVAGALVVAAAGMGALALSGGADERPAQPAAQRAASTPAAASRGLAVWAEQGCGSCHTFEPANAAGTFGPDLELSLRGTDAAYIRRSIVEPSAASAAGYSSGMMPEDYAGRMSPADLESLVRFIARGVGG
jgi:mono/diheme cytochrome c family protein